MTLDPMSSTSNPVWWYSIPEPTYSGADDSGPDELHLHRLHCGARVNVTSAVAVAVFFFDDQARGRGLDVGVIF
jgi:hypothetical protein